MGEYFDIEIGYIKNALDELIEIYKQMEADYGIDLTSQVNAVKRVKNIDIHDAIWLAKHSK